MRFGAPLGSVVWHRVLASVRWGDSVPCACPVAHEGGQTLVCHTVSALESHVSIRKGFCTPNRDSIAPPRVSLQAVPRRSCPAPQTGRRRPRTHSPRLHTKLGPVERLGPLEVVSPRDSPHRQRPVSASLVRHKLVPPFVRYKPEPWFASHELRLWFATRKVCLDSQSRGCLKGSSQWSNANSWREVDNMSNL